MTNLIEGNVSNISDKMEGSICSMTDEISCNMRCIADEMKAMHSMAFEMERNVRSLENETQDETQKRKAGIDLIENPNRQVPANVAFGAGGADHSLTLPENRYLEFDSLDEDARSCVQDRELKSALLSRTTKAPICNVPNPYPPENSPTV